MSRKRRRGRRNLRGLLNLIAERDGEHCHWCRCATVRVPSFHSGPLKDNHATVDHIIPRYAGGTDDLNNLVLACNRCNNCREDSRPPKWLAPERMPITEERLLELIA